MTDQVTAQNVHYDQNGQREAEIPCLGLGLDVMSCSVTFSVGHWSCSGAGLPQGTGGKEMISPMSYQLQLLCPTTVQSKLPRGHWPPVSPLCPAEGSSEKDWMDFSNS